MPDGPGQKRAIGNLAAWPLRARSPLRFWFAAVAFAIVVLAGCGGDKNSGATETSAGSGQTRTKITGDGATTVESDDVDDDYDSCQETSCDGFVYRRGDGSLSLCSRLEVAPEAVVVPAPVTTDTETETETGETTTETETSETTTEPQTETVHRLRCADGAVEIPVEGLELDEVSEVSTLDGGQAEWTAVVIGVHGKIVDGTLVADE